MEGPHVCKTFLRNEKKKHIQQKIHIDMKLRTRTFFRVQHARAAAAASFDLLICSSEKMAVARAESCRERNKSTQRVCSIPDLNNQLLSIRMTDFRNAVDTKLKMKPVAFIQVLCCWRIGVRGWKQIQMIILRIAALSAYIIVSQFRLVCIIIT
jgi:hypothetical protein